jgi:hypothetical protein
MLLNGRIRAPFAAFMHMPIVAGLALWTWRSKRFRGDIGWPLLLTTLLAVFGPLGALGTLVTMSLTRFYSRSAIPFEEWYASLFPERHLDPNSELVQRIRAHLSTGTPGAAGVTPFVDILAFGTLAQKQELITLVTKHFQPAFAPALRMALRDPNNSIRVQGASSVTKIENDLMARSMELCDAVKSQPANPQLQLALAAHYDEYAATGLLDPEQEAASRESALETYRKYLTLQPGDERARAAAGRLLLRAGRAAEALDWIGGSIARGHLSADTLLPYMESLFSLHRYSDLRELARTHYKQLAADDGLTSESLEAVKLWAAAE